MARDLGSFDCRRSLLPFISQVASSTQLGRRSLLEWLPVEFPDHGCAGSWWNTNETDCRDRCLPSWQRQHGQSDPQRNVFSLSLQHLRTLHRAENHE